MLSCGTFHAAGSGFIGGTGVGGQVGSFWRGIIVDAVTFTRVADIAERCAQRAAGGLSLRTKVRDSQQYACDTRMFSLYTRATAELLVWSRHRRTGRTTSESVLPVAAKTGAAEGSQGTRSGIGMTDEIDGARSYERLVPA